MNIQQNIDSLKLYKDISLIFTPEILSNTYVRDFAWIFLSIKHEDNACFVQNPIRINIDKNQDYQIIAAKNITNLVKNCEFNKIVIRLSLNCYDFKTDTYSSHTNMIIIDKQYKTIKRFEPNGVKVYNTQEFCGDEFLVDNILRDSSSWR